MRSPRSDLPSAEFARGLKRVLEWVATGTDVMATALLLLLLTVVFAMVLTRNVFNLGFAWLDDLARYLQIWVVYTAAISITMKGEHITMDAAYNRMPQSWRLMVRRFTGIISLVFCAITCSLAIKQAIGVIRLREVSSTGVFPAIFGYASLPFGFCLMAAASLYYLLYISGQHDDIAS
jgi:TRAP-type C4-dicarboxylate transport system permease small subunit